MSDPDLPTADDFLFGRGLTIDDYFINEAHGCELICFTDRDGREFDLHVNDESLKASAVSRLRVLGVRVKV